MKEEIDAFNAVIESVKTRIVEANYIDIAMTAVGTVLLLVLCIIVKRILMKFTTNVLDRVHMEQGIRKFLRSLINVLLWFVISLIVLYSLGIEPAPLVAAFSVVGLALSLAVQDSLSNFTGGVNVLASKPFMVGDYVEIESDGGIVDEIGIVYTTLLTFDNRRIMLPNSKVMSARIINYSSEKMRRVDIPVATSYNDDITKVQAVLLAMGSRHEKALQDPEPTVKVTNYGDSAIEYVLRVWAFTEDYWDVYFDLMEQVKPELDGASISIPYPHMNVLLEQQKTEK